jgi:TetR/AcrR family transcriptional regulator, cholesterol catabolism regulator
LATKKVSIVLLPIMEPKERILYKAHELYNKFGVRSVSMDDIATSLGISKKTVYQCYADKEELVRAVFDIILNDNQSRCTRDHRESENALHEIFLALDMMQEMFAKMNPVVLFDLQKYHPEIYQKFHQHKNGFLYQLIKSNLENGIKEELYRPDLDVEVVARFRIESIFIPFNSEAFPNNRTHLVQIEQELADLFLYGIVTAKGLKLFQKYKKQRTKF